MSHVDLERLELFAAGTLDMNEQAAVAEHLSACETCAKEARWLEAERRLNLCSWSRRRAAAGLRDLLARSRSEVGGHAGPEMGASGPGSRRGRTRCGDLVDHPGAALRWKHAQHPGFGRDLPSGSTTRRPGFRPSFRVCRILFQPWADVHECRWPSPCCRPLFVEPSWRIEMRLSQLLPLLVLAFALSDCHPERPPAPAAEGAAPGEGVAGRGLDRRRAQVPRAG